MGKKPYIRSQLNRNGKFYSTVVTNESVTISQNVGDC